MTALSSVSIIAPLNSHTSPVLFRFAGYLELFLAIRSLVEKTPERREAVGRLSMDVAPSAPVTSHNEFEFAVTHALSNLRNKKYRVTIHI